MTRDLDGKVALVTGGGRGIGRAISLNLAKRGASLVVGYMRNRAAAEEVCILAEAEAVKALPVRANLGDAAHVAALVRQLEDAFGRCDVIVSNAATGVIGSFEDLDERAWSWTMDANARALMLLVKGVLPFMSPGGRVVALSSQGANRVLPGYTVVGASKAAIESLARYLAVELGSRDVTVNVVSPGVVETEALRHFPNRDRIIGEACAKTPLRRLVRPEDVANAVDFLTSAAAEVITGQVLVVDGGASLLA